VETGLHLHSASALNGVNGKGHVSAILAPNKEPTKYTEYGAGLAPVPD